MLDYTEYNSVFPSPGIINPYDYKGTSAIETFRKSFRGVLFVDRVLSRLGIGQGQCSVNTTTNHPSNHVMIAPFNANHHCNLGTAYPPKGENGLRSLHQQICQSSVSSHQKLSLLYYLLLDHDGIHPGRSQWADGFAEEAGLPRKYQVLMRGLWHMDRKEVKVRLFVSFHWMDIRDN